MELLLALSILAGFALAGILFVKSILFWVCLWQVKEYRFDRFWAEYGDAKKLLKFWFFSGGRRFRAPVWTKKAILIFSISFVAVVFMAISISFNWILFAFYLWLYLFIPVIVAVIVFIFKIPTLRSKEKTYREATVKIKKMKNLLVVGITGSYGKSSTKEFLAQILSYKFKVAKTPENNNTEIGIAKFILEGLPSDAQIFVVEMGAYKIGEINRICEIVKPKIAMLTGINEQHMDLFGSLANIKKAKYELIENLPDSGLKILLPGLPPLLPAAFFNGEDQRVWELAGKWQGKGFLYRKNIIAPKRNIPKHYEINLDGAIDVARYLGMADAEIEQAIKKIDFTDKMIKSYKGKNDVLVIEDVYSSNPDGVLAALDYLSEELRKTKIVIMPSIIELGPAAKEVHKRIGKKAGEFCSLLIITTKDNFEDIKEGVGDGFDKLTTGRAVFENNPLKIMELLKDKLNSDTVILLEGRLPDVLVSQLR